MQAAQRVSHNAALELAAAEANRLGLPLVALFCVTDQVPEANLRHYRFLLEGLWETGRLLRGRGIPLVLALGEAEECVPELAQSAAAVVCDRGYLRWQREARAAVRKQLKALRIPCLEAETEVIVPVGEASFKEEYTAATLRAKLLKTVDKHAALEIAPTPIQHPAKEAAFSLPDRFYRYHGSFGSAEELFDWVLAELQIDASLRPTTHFQGGPAQAKLRLEEFRARRLAHYAKLRNDPGQSYQSDLSPYLHFGQISALEIVQSVLSANGLAPSDTATLIRHKAEFTGNKASCASFLEEIIVRRELSANFCQYNPDYDSYHAIPVWARESLEKYASDSRPYLYSLEQLDAAQTHDPYWNAAQREMEVTGKMHNYMRMYWGKKLIEWTPDPETAFHWMLYLNNRYNLDGRDPNSYAGIAWCFGKHDRPWQTRPVFGSVRYMNAQGLERKFDMAAYLHRVRGLEP